MPSVVIAAVAAVAGSAIISKYQQDKAREAANKAAEKQAAAAAQQYQQLTEGEMKLSLMTSKTQDIIDVINATSQPGPVYTLPSEATPTDPIARINQAIDDMIKGK